MTKAPVSQDEDYKDLVDLTSRQRQIYLMLSQDMTPQDVSDRLHIEVSTVQAHVYNAKQRTGYETTLGLAAAVAIEAALAEITVI